MPTLECCDLRLLPGLRPEIVPSLTGLPRSTDPKRVCPCISIGKGRHLRGRARQKHQGRPQTGTLISANIPLCGLPNPHMEA